MKVIFFNGTIDYLILSILNKQDNYAYNIEKIIHKLSNNDLSIARNTIYTALYRLEQEGKISGYSEPVARKRTKVYFHIEQSGIEYLSFLNECYNSFTRGVNSLLVNLEKGDLG